MRYKKKLTTLQVRQKLGDILNTVYYQSRIFQITRKGNTMGLLVPNDLVKLLREGIAEDKDFAKRLEELIGKKNFEQIKQTDW